MKFKYSLGIAHENLASDLNCKILKTYCKKDLKYFDNNLCWLHTDMSWIYIETIYISFPLTRRWSYRLNLIQVPRVGWTAPWWCCRLDVAMHQEAPWVRQAGCQAVGRSHLVNLQTVPGGDTAAPWAHSPHSCTARCQHPLTISVWISHFTGDCELLLL